MVTHQISGFLTIKMRLNKYKLVHHVSIDFFDIVTMDTTAFNCSVCESTTHSYL